MLRDPISIQPTSNLHPLNFKVWSKLWSKPFTANRFWPIDFSIRTSWSFELYLDYSSPRLRLVSWALRASESHQTPMIRVFTFFRRTFFLVSVYWQRIRPIHWFFIWLFWLFSVNINGSLWSLIQIVRQTVCQIRSTTISPPPSIHH